MFNIIFVSPTSCTLELNNKDIYYAKKDYDIYVDDVLVLKNVKTNVVSLYNLKPNKEYKIKINDCCKIVKTKNVSCIFNIEDFGVKKNGIDDDTKAINQAIMMIPENGLLVFNEGTYKITSLFLKSNISVELKNGATLLASSNIDDYPIYKGELPRYDVDDNVQLGQWEGNPFPVKASIISGYWLKNVNLYGEGTIDGNAQNGAWWHDVKHLPWGRPRLLFLDGCDNIQIQGLHFQNTPCWTLHPFFSNNLGFYDIRVKNPKDSPNTDGMDPESCNGVNIIGAVFSVGDDCIAIKSGKMYMGMKYKTPSSNFVIRNCMMQDGHGAIVLGSEMSGGVKNLQVERCIFKKTDRGLRIKTRRGRGKYAIIDGVEFSDILMDGVLTPLVINMFYFCDPDGKTEYVWSKDKLPVDDRTPYLGKFTFKDIVATDVEWAAGYFYGLPEQPIGEINIENCSFKYKKEASEGCPAMMSFAEKVSKRGFSINYVKKVALKNVTLDGNMGDKFVLNSVDEVYDDK